MGKDILTIGNKKIPVELMELKQADLSFWHENPRVYSALNVREGFIPTQEEIEEQMCSMEHVKELREAIASNGGLIDALIVRKKDLTVLEGNSRLAAYRMLAKQDPVKWGLVKCQILPDTITDSEIFKLLGQYHIVGRKDWEPYEQACYLYRQTQSTRMPVDGIARELGISAAKAKKMIDTVRFMREHDDVQKRHWSHYEEYLKNAGIRKLREEHPELDARVAEEIKKDQIYEARDIRTLGEIANVGDAQSEKLVAKIVSGETSLYDAAYEMEKSGKLDDIVKSLRKFKEMINKDVVEDQIVSSAKSRTSAGFEIKQIVKRLENLQHKLKLER